MELDLRFQWIQQIGKPFGDISWIGDVPRQ